MLLRSLPRATRQTSTTPSLHCSRRSHNVIRSYTAAARPTSPLFQAAQEPITSQQPHQTRTAHAISNPTLAGIEKRWESMPLPEQAELWMQLRDRMKVDWNEMTLQEKKAGMNKTVLLFRQSCQYPSIYKFTGTKLTITPKLLSAYTSLLTGQS
jgi:cytochrome c oxidase subunit 4